VQGDLLESQGIAQGLHPGAKTSLEGGGIQAVENPFEGVVGGAALVQFEEAFEPVVAFAGEGGDLLPIVAAADDSADGDGNKVAQQILAAMPAARILEQTEVFLDGEVRVRHGFSSVKASDIRENRK